MLHAPRTLGGTVLYPARTLLCLVFYVPGALPDASPKAGGRRPSALVLTQDRARFLSLLMFLCILFVPGSKFTYQSTIRNILPYLSNAKRGFFAEIRPFGCSIPVIFPHSTDFQSDRWQKLPNASTCVFSSFRVYYGYKDKGGLSHERGIRPQLHHPDRRGRQRH